MSALVHERRAVTIREAAARLHFSERTICRLIANGRLRAVEPDGPRRHVARPLDELERLRAPKEEP